MFLRVNGLFGWVQVNDRRSIALFAGFLAALNVAAALVLYLPLLAFDPDHAPVAAWGGYATRYCPLVTLTCVGLFALHMAGHVRSVQRAVAFAFVDDADEPRLCRLVEPLAIGMGLPAPYVGVIESRALNAFACGLHRGNAVVVVTRGLIDALDDDELGAVLAHELAHIANGDIRLMAAANTCLRIVRWLVMPRLKRSDRLREVLAFPAIMAAMPPLFLFALIVSLCAQTALRGSRLIRLAIASSREFVADARAAEATQNPAALVSALRRIDGRSRLPDLAPGQDAMMIDGDSEGGFATHPTIARRIEAIVAVTGSMALIAPPRRDTRPQNGAMPAGSSIRASVFGTPVAAGAPKRSALGRIAVDDDRNWLGLTPAMTVGAVLALAVFVGLHARDLRNPAALAAILDPRPTGAMFAVVGRQLACNAAVIGDRVIGLSKPARCDAVAMQDFLVAQARTATGPVGAMMSAMTQAPDGLHIHPDGHFSSTPPQSVEAAEVASKRCYRTRGYRPGDAGMHRIDEAPRHDRAFDIRRWLESTEWLAVQAAATGPEASDKPLKAYLEGRKFHYELIDHFFGEPGLALARSAFASSAHHRAVERLGERLRDGRWAGGLSPVERAEATLLATHPNDFITCVARRRMTAQRS